VTNTLARSAGRGALAVRDRIDLGHDAVLDLAVRTDLDGQYGAQVSPRAAAEPSRPCPSARSMAMK
jgi:outer membrane receptor for ferrienterochelin and colicin